MRPRIAGPLATGLLLGLFLAALVVPLVTDGVIQDRAFPFAPPSSAHWIGTDGFGRDVFARLFGGARVSLVAGLLATLIALGAGTLAGTVSGYYAGWRDDLITRTGELFQSLPWLYLILAVREFLPLTIGEMVAMAAIASIAGLTAWPRPALLIRGIVLSERTRDYVATAKAFGASDFYVIRRHILPATFGAMHVQFVLLLPQFVLAEVTLSFLGLGFSEPTPSLGTMMASLRNLHVLSSYPWMLAPAVLLILVSGCCHIIARHLRE